MRNRRALAPDSRHRPGAHVKACPPQDAAMKPGLRAGSPLLSIARLSSMDLMTRPGAARSGDAPAGKCGRSRRARAHPQVRRVRRMEHPLLVRDFCVGARRAVRHPGRIAVVRLRAGRLPVGAQRRHATCHPATSSAHTTNVVTNDVWLEIPRRPLTSRAQRRNPISTNVVTLASTPATKGVTRCAVSTKVVTQ